MDLQLRDRVYVVTGGSSGVGLATVRMLLDEGAKVVTCARDAERLAAVLREQAPDAADRVAAVGADVRVRADVDAVIDTAVTRFGGLDGVVNNAGGSRMAPRSETTLDDWRDELDLKFSSVLNTVDAALEHLRRSDAGAIVNVNAVLARQPESRLVATSAARAGLLNLSKSLAAELAPDVRVNSVLLGLIDTGQWRRRYEQTDGSQTFADWESDIAADRGVILGRFGAAEEVASMIVMLLSPVASYVTGASLDVAGGVARYV